MVQIVHKNGETHLLLTLNTKISINGITTIKSFAEIKVVLDQEDVPLETIVTCHESGGTSETTYNKTGGEFGINYFIEHITLGVPDGFKLIDEWSLPESEKSTGTFNCRVKQASGEVIVLVMAGNFDKIECFSETGFD